MSPDDGRSPDTAGPRATQPVPVLPAYAGASLAGVVPALMAPPGRRPDWLPPVAAAAGQVILLVVDGLGWGQLVTRAGLAPNITGLTGGAMTSVVPTTTATALTSIAFGTPPAAHGMVGYRLKVTGRNGNDEVLNALHWTTHS
ncbi:MAG TPA: alkaline phosphatase family protein, partial [Acidimicrobiales bacterium]